MCYTRLETLFMVKLVIVVNFLSKFFLIKGPEDDLIQVETCCSITYIDYCLIKIAVL